MPFRSRRKQWGNSVTAHAPQPSAAYTAQGVRFNGSTILNASALSGIVDGQKGILSFWFKFTGGDGSYQLLIETRDQQSVELYRDNTGHWTFKLATPALGNALDWVSTATFTSSMTNWAHVLVAWDLSGSGSTSAYFTDTAAASSPTFTGGSTVNYLTADTNWDLGARTGLVIPLTCDIADFYLNTAEFLDFTVTANRRKFISASLAPVDLGATGSIPTGTAPILFLHGPLASWHTNDGTGGGFSVVSGGLTAAATNPP